jgi:glutamate dehydrogenase/leucine dehydrogenase
MSNVDSIVSRMYQAAEIIGLDERLLVILPTFKNKWETDLLVTMADGRKQSIRAMRFWHRSPYTDMPYKGGIRYHPDIDSEMMKSHAMEMSLKCWVMGIEMGGAKGGLAIDPTKFSKQELKDITENYVNEMVERNNLGPYLDVPAPDVGTTPEIMKWIRQAFGQRLRTHQTSSLAGVVTGKPIDFGSGGIPGRTPATGYGLMVALNKIMKLKKLNPQNLNRVAVIGFGNVGYHIAGYLAQKGFKIVAVSDINGGVYNPEGLNWELSNHVKSPYEMTGDKITNEELICLKDIDILVPAALENNITGKNAEKISAKIILEGANGPTTPEADAILARKGVLVIPDILANAGGVSVSYFEWGRNQNHIDERIPVARNGSIVTEEEVLQAMAKMMEYSAGKVFEYSQRYEVSLRLAAYAFGLERIAPLLKSKYFV